MRRCGARGADARRHRHPHRCQPSRTWRGPRPASRSRSKRRRDTQIISGSHLLIAAGRRPNIDALNLKAAGIKVDANGIQRQPPPADLQQARSMRSATLPAGRASPMSRTITPGWWCATRCSVCASRSTTTPFPQVTFTDPEIAHVGLTEAARAKEIPQIAHPALVLSRQRPRPGRARNPRPDQGHHRQARQDSGRDHRRPAGRRTDFGMDARDRAKSQYPRHGGRWSRPIRRWAKSASARRSVFHARPMATHGCGASSSGCAVG